MVRARVHTLRPQLIISLLLVFSVISCRQATSLPPAPPPSGEAPTPVVEPTVTPVPQPLGNNPAISETNRWFPANLKRLTDDEKSKAIEIALSSPAALEWRQKENKYTTTFSWRALFPDAPGGNYSGYRIFEYEIFEKGIPIYPPGTVVLAVDPKTTEVYPNVDIRFGEPAQWVVSVALDIKTGRIVFVEDYPAGKGIVITPPNQ